MANTVQISSNNYSGQTANITFYPCSGGTISLGSQIIPYTYSSDYFYGQYSLYFSAYNSTCTYDIVCPSPTPTVTSTPTNTPTKTITPTPTITPTKTNTPTPTNTPNLQGFNYTNFASTTGLALVGNAAVTSNIIYLTTANTGQAGNVYRTSSIQFNRNFSAQWEMIIGGGTGADGYCVQWTTTNNSTGVTGGGVGRIDVSSTINALSFTTYPSVQNLTWYKSNVSQGTQTGPISWRQTAYYWLDYVHSTSTASLYISTTSTKPGSPSFTYTGFTFDSTNYYMGFGAATGGSTDNHELVNWKLQFT